MSVLLRALLQASPSFRVVHFDRVLSSVRTAIGFVLFWQIALPKRPRTHHVYYALALFDVLTVIASLALTHHTIGKLSDTVKSSLEWNAIHNDFAKLRAIGGRINAPGNDIFESKNPAHELSRLDAAVADFAPSLTAIRRRIEEKAQTESWNKIAPWFTAIDRSIADMANITRLVLTKFSAGDAAAAAADMAAMDRLYSETMVKLEEAGALLRAFESDSAQKQLAGTQAFRQFELVLVAMILLMIFFVTQYGKRVSALIEQQQQQLAAFNVDLEGRVAARTSELQASQTELDLQKQELHRRNFHFEVALNNMNRGLCLFDSDYRLVVANRRYLEMYGLEADQVGPGTTLREIIELRAEHGSYAAKDVDRLYAERVAVVQAGKTVVSLQSIADGRILEIGHYPLADGGWVATHDDITDRRRMEDQVVHLAYHDSLTGLPNRRKVGEELESALKRAERGERFAVLCMDLDHFKQVNDTLGHGIGDRLLQAVGERLRQVVRKGDVIARLGGDEFAVIQFQADQQDSVTALADRIISELSQPFEIDGHRLVIGVSIGIAFAPTDGEDAGTLLKNADLALYRAKSETRGVFRLFAAEMDQLAKARRQLELDLRSAMLLDEFELFYQPLVETVTGSISGFEALIRWRNGRRGLVSPLEFIPMAEEIGLMGEIGAWVLRRACAEAVMWPSHCRVAVNISPTQFRTRKLDFDVMTALAESGLSPHRLEIEITESVLLDQTDSIMTVLHRLRDLGVKIAMDDFGTGYSSLSYLHSFPFDKIKIDRSFTQSSDESSKSKAIVQAVLNLGKNLGMSTTAEGVETVEQLNRLRDEGCIELQGYLFSRPVPASEVPQLLKTLAVNACHAA